MIAFRAGGRSAATWSELNPEYEVPYMPTLPFDHSCSASHAIVATWSWSSAVGVLVDGVALGRTGAADVGSADREVPLVTQPAVDRRRVREIVLPIRTSLEDDRPRGRCLWEVQGERDPHPVVHLDGPELVGHPRTVLAKPHPGHDSRPVRLTGVGVAREGDGPPEEGGCACEHASGDAPRSPLWPRSRSRRSLPMYRPSPRSSPRRQRC